MSTVNVNVDVGACKVFYFEFAYGFQGYFKNILWFYVNCILIYQWV
jgi:hypothetical protein